MSNNEDDDSFDDSSNERDFPEETDNESKEEEEFITTNIKKEKPRQHKRDKVVDGMFMGDTKVLSALYRQLIEVQNKYGCTVNMPQFAFIGVQSSGKSSALSQMLNMPSGVVQDGTGTRCPVRFTLKQDDNLSDRRIYVNQRLVKNYIAMTQAVCDYTKNLGEKFDDTILEVEITGPQIPNFVIVDLPGIMRKKKTRDSQVLQRMTKRFLTDKLPNNAGFAYIPVFIRAAVDLENDNDPEEIDRLCKRIRPNWRKESIIVINKIDMSWNRDSDDLTHYMQQLIKDNPDSTVICMCNPNGARIDANKEKVKENEKYIKAIPKIEKEKWEKKLQEIGDSRRLHNLVDEYCFVGRLKKLMRDRSIEIVKESIGPVKAKLETVERKFISDIKNRETQLHNCKASNIRSEKSRFDDEFLKVQLAFYKGEMGIEVEGYALTWEDEMRKFFSYRRNNTDDMSNKHRKDDADWVKNYYLSPNDLLEAFKDKRQPKDATDNSERLKLSMEARLMGSAAIFRALEIWRAMISFMSLSIYSVEQVLNTMDFFHHHLYSNVEDTVQKLLLKASENLKNGCVWLGNYIRWKLRYDAQLLYIYLTKQKIKEEEQHQNMERIYKFTLIEYKEYVNSIVKDFINTAKIEPRDLCAIFDSISTHHYVNLGKLINKDFKSLHKLNDKGKDHQTEDRANIYRKELEEMRQSRVTFHNSLTEEINENEVEEDDDDSSSAEPLSDNDNNNNNNDLDDNKEIEDIDDEVEIVNQKEKEHESQLSHNKDRDMDFFFHVYGLPNKMFGKRDDVDYIRNYAGVHWKYIKFHVIKTIQEKFSHRIMYHIKQRSTDLSRALREGVEKPKLDSLVKTLALQAKIPIDLLAKSVTDLKKKNEENVGTLENTSFTSLNDDELEKTYGVDTDSLRKEIAQLKTDLGNFKKSKEEINQNLFKIENSANFDSNNNMVLMD